MNKKQGKMEENIKHKTLDLQKQDRNLPRKQGVSQHQLTKKATKICSSWLIFLAFFASWLNVMGSADRVMQLRAY